MNLIDENVEKESEEKQKKVTKIIIFTIIALVIIIVLILLYSFIKNKNTLKLYVGNKSNELKSEMFLMQDKKNLYVSDSGQIYISVRDLATMLNIEFYNDEYKGKGEDKSKCYIKTGNEYTSYLSNSSEIYKVIDNKSKNEALEEANKSKKDSNSDIIKPNDYEYEYFTINDGVRYVNDKIYASEEAIELGFNVNVTYDQKEKTIKINTLDDLQQIAVNTVGNMVVTDGIEYYNKKLLKYGLVLIKNGNNSYGITDYINYQAGSNLVSCKYTDIKFIESLGCFIVTDNEDNKQGILKIDLKGNKEVIEIVKPIYKELRQLSEDGSLYIIRENDKYGILKITEDEQGIKTENVLKTEYQTIGISDYSKYDNMESRYIINNKYVPIKANNKWGLASMDGEIIVTPKYDLIGCDKGKDATGSPVICVPELIEGNDAIVFGNVLVDAENNNISTETYILLDVEKMVNIGYDSLEIYSVINNNERVYYMKIMAADQSIHKLDIYNRYYVAKKSESSNRANYQNNNNYNNNNSSSNDNNNSNSSNNNNNSSNNNNSNSYNNSNNSNNTMETQSTPNVQN